MGADPQGPSLVACPHCDTLHERVELTPRGRALCACCGANLYRRGVLDLNGWTAMSLAALAVFVIAQGFPIVSLSLQGRGVSVTYWEALLYIWDQGDWLLSIMTGLFGFWFPLLKIVLTLWAVRCISTGRIPGDFTLGMRLLRALTPWSMAPVLVLAIFVAIVKFAGMAALTVEPGMLGFFLLSFFLTGLGRLNAFELWDHAERAGLVETSGAHGSDLACHACGCVQGACASGRCRRCGARLHRRRQNITARVWALALAAAVVYVPANILPIMRIESILGASDHTILGGVVELWRLGSWDLALIVFVASVVVPITKLLALAVLMLLRQPRGARVQRQRTRMYEMVEFIGQWSMLDVFVVVLMGAMANFPGLTRILPGPGALSFGVVVILTMWATMSYDPRLGWDKLRSGDR
ncbi:paraquat-inducible protein A [Castellaniella sp. GW247-6E4]|uniref:paraquat-inducible protein A n=1 Tax=Castellaniella sp. GW247-6E4 TaxID=3140380 RepID=UPI0033160338